MKQKEWVMSLLVIMVLLFGIVMPVAAQDGGMPTNCNGLSDEDCAFLTEASLAMQGSMMQSLAIPSWSFDLNLDAGSEAIMASGSGSARLVLSDALVAMMSDMPQMAMDMETFNMDALMAFYEQLNADMIVALLEGLGAELVIDHVSLEAPGQAMSLNATVFFKDMGAYLHTTAPNGAEAWFGEQLEITQDMKDELDAGLAEMIAGMQDPQVEEAFGQLGDMTALFTPLIELANAYVTTTRGEDVELFGQTNYAFTTAFDLKGLLADAGLPAAIMAILEDPMLAELSGQEMGMEINEQQIQFVLMTAGMLLGETQISTTQWIGADDMLPHKMSLDLALNADLSLLGDPSMTAVTADASFMLEMDGYNTTTLDDVEVPADYYSMDASSDFLAGGPEMIEAELALGQTFSGSLTDSDNTDVYAITLDAGQSATLELVSEDYPYVAVYGPDGFQLNSFDLYYDEEMIVEANADGVYLIKIEGYWELDYDLTVRAE